jgi:hypothetical protein
MHPKINCALFNREIVQCNKHIAYYTNHHKILHVFRVLDCELAMCKDFEDHSIDLIPMYSQVSTER